jgi:hypothetical protein
MLMGAIGLGVGLVVGEPVECEGYCALTHLNPNVYAEEGPF